MAYLNTTPVGDRPPHKAALSSTDRLEVSTDGLVDLDFGPDEPQGPASNRVDTAPTEGLFVWSALQSERSVLQQDVIAKDRHAREPTEVPDDKRW